MKKENLVLKQACIDLGGQAAMARLLGVSAPTINQWINGIRQIPAERCPEIEKATSGAVTCEQLRPDVDWTYLRGTRPCSSGQATSAA
ncbi:phage protein [Serratia marcescens subsp. marcescens Db11]|uniref:Phage protein n=1 Tax=Serratia marcescens subsp. marcescens Db11 TaxID=273526 RepID=A0ABC9IKA9_SERMA|nr:helix-turn-helix domain-containing protein [Serratia marcescens]CDG13195.1 phage protein [Serratia marcescens subsp. marcescens Db11]